MELEVARIARVEAARTIHPVECGSPLLPPFVIVRGDFSAL